MYPRNAASPQRIAIGPVVQISDGAVQTSGVSVIVLPFGTTASAGGGTVGYEQGIVHYIPTQAETNYTSFILIAYKTGCIPATVTVVTTASATAGTVLLAPTTHTSAVIPTVSTLTGHTAQTGDSFALANGASGFVAIKGETASILTDTAEIGAAGAGLTALASAANLATLAGYVDTEVAAIKAKTDNLPAAPASTTNITAGTLTTVGGVGTGGITAASFGAGAIDAASLAADAGTEIATAVWASAARTLTAATNFNNISTSDVLTQVNAAIDTAISELGVAAPTATPTLRTGLMLLYMALRNKLVVQTSGTDALEIYNDAGTKIASKLITDTGGDYTEAEMS